MNMLLNTINSIPDVTGKKLICDKFEQKQGRMYY